MYEAYFREMGDGEQRSSVFGIEQKSGVMQIVEILGSLICSLSESVHPLLCFRVHRVGKVSYAMQKMTKLQFVVVAKLISCNVRSGALEERLEKAFRRAL